MLLLLLLLLLLLGILSSLENYYYIPRYFVSSFIIPSSSSSLSSPTTTIQARRTLALSSSSIIIPRTGKRRRSCCLKIEQQQHNNYKRTRKEKSGLLFVQKEDADAAVETEAAALSTDEKVNDTIEKQQQPPQQRQRQQSRYLEPKEAGRPLKRTGETNNDMDASLDTNNIYALRTEMKRLTKLNPIPPDAPKIATALLQHMFGLYYANNCNATEAAIDSAADDDTGDNADTNNKKSGSSTTSNNNNNNNNNNYRRRRYDDYSKKINVRDCTQVIGSWGKIYLPTKTTITTKEILRNSNLNSNVTSNSNSNSSSNSNNSNSRKKRKYHSNYKYNKQQQNQQQQRNDRNTRDDLTKRTTALTTATATKTTPMPQQEALQILDEMVRVYETDRYEHIRPNVVTYTSVMNIFAKAGDLAGAYNIFERQVQDFKNNGNYNAKPNSRTFRTMIQACTKSFSYNNNGNNNKNGSNKYDKKNEYTYNKYNNKNEYKYKYNNHRNRNIKHYSTSSNNDNMRSSKTSNSTSISNNDSNNRTIASKSDNDNNNTNNNAPYIAERMLETMRDWYEHDLIDDGPTTITYTGVIGCWCKSFHVPEAPQRARKLLEFMMEQYDAWKILEQEFLEETKTREKQSEGQEHGDRRRTLPPPPPRPNAVTYSTMLDAYAQRSDIISAKEIWTIMEHDWLQKGNTQAQPGVQAYTVMIKAWSKALKENGRNDAPLEAEKLLRQMIELYSNGELKEGPNFFTYGTLINCWAKSDRPEAPQRARQILECMTTGSDNPSLNIRPNTITYAIVMDGYARRGDIHGCLEVFETMKKDYHENRNYSANPYMIRIYGTIMTAWSKSKLEEAPKESEKLMTDIIDLYSRGIMNEPPNHHTYSILINCWSKSNHPNATTRSKEILQTMIDKSKTKKGTNNDDDLRPNVIIYNSVMDACARHGDLDSALEIWEWLLNDTSGVRPNIRTYNTLIFAWSKIALGNSLKFSHSRSSEAPYQAEKLLNKMIALYSNGTLKESPNTIAYSIVINCWSKSSNNPEAPQRARNLLESMIARSRDPNISSNCIPNEITYHSVLDAYSKHGDITGALDIMNIMKEDYRSGNKLAKPELQTYSILIDTWSKSNRPDAPKEAENILMELIDLYQKGELPDGPDTIIYSTVINCWSKSAFPEATRRARDMLDFMINHYKQTGNEKVRPNTITYNTVMDAFARKGDVDGANEVFRMMKDDYDSGRGNISAKPNVPSYNTLINSWAKSGNPNAPIKAEQILQEMIHSYEKGVLLLGPDTIVYSSVINCWSKSDFKDGPVRAKVILEAMISKSKENKNIRPNQITYNSVLDAYSRIGDVDGCKHIIRMMKEAKTTPDILSYNILIGCWSRSGQPNAHLEAEKILLQILDNDDEHESSVAANAITYTSVINCWSKSNLPEAPERAKKILARMVLEWSSIRNKNDNSKDVTNNWPPRPNKFSYNSVMDSYARQGNNTGTNEVFDMMKDDYIRLSNYNAKPDLTTYNILMNALFKHVDNDNNVDEDKLIITKAEALLSEIKTLHESCDLDSGPNDVTYTTFISLLDNFEGTEGRILALNAEMEALPIKEK